MFPFPISWRPVVFDQGTGPDPVKNYSWKIDDPDSTQRKIYVEICGDNPKSRGFKKRLRDTYQRYNKSETATMAEAAGRAHRGMPRYFGVWAPVTAAECIIELDHFATFLLGAKGLGGSKDNCPDDPPPPPPVPVRKPVRVEMPQRNPGTNERIQIQPAREINWNVAFKTLGYGLATVGSAALTVVSGIATVGTAIDPIPGDEVALGAGTAAMAGVTATSATLFYFFAREFLKNLF